MLKQTNTWLEPLLTRELRRAAAPPEVSEERLWASPAPGSFRAHRNPPSLWFACASAAGFLLVSAVGLHAYITSAAPLAGRQAAKAVRFQAWVQASTGLDIHGACRLCHADEELRAAVHGGSERLLAGAFAADAGVY